MSVVRSDFFFCYTLYFPTNLLVNMYFVGVGIFLRFYSPFTIFAHQKSPKNDHGCMKEIWNQSMLLLLLKIHVIVFDKTVS